MGMFITRLVTLLGRELHALGLMRRTSQSLFALVEGSMIHLGHRAQDRHHARPDHRPPNSRPDRSHPGRGRKGSCSGNMGIDRLALPRSAVKRY
jgi:hypothetical protein